jgi:DNA-binding protein HU-beta
MAKALTKSQVISTLAEKTELPKKTVKLFFNELNTLAYKEAQNTFTLPGFGKLALVERKARLGRNPATGETIQIPAKTVVKFKIAKACKEAVLANKG